MVSRGPFRLVAQVNTAVGPDSTVDSARRAISDYHGENAAWALDRLLTTPEGVREAIKAYGDLGASEVVLYCWSPDIDQVDRLADVVA